MNAIVSEAVSLTAGDTKPATAVSTTSVTPAETVMDLLPPEAIPAPAEARVIPSVSVECEFPNPEPLLSVGNDMPDETDVLLSMMGFGAESGNAPPEPVISSHTGEAFWEWLLAGCRTGRLAINQPDARIHVVAGFVFLRTPGIFHQYLSETGVPKDDKVLLQRAFERLGHHRQDRGAMYTCQLYENEQHEGRFRKLNGYLISASKVFIGKNIPRDNLLLVVV